MINKNICLLSNLVPATLRGVESQGMLLAADDGQPHLLELNKSKPGEAVRIKNWKNNNKQITYEEFLKIPLTTKDGKVVFEGNPLHTATEEVVAAIKDGAKVK